MASINTSDSGIIYLLTNPAMPGIIKIGRSTRVDVKERMRELFSSGVPLPFECVYAARVVDINKVEQALHHAFGPQRINPKREFFEIEASQAIGIIKLLEIENVTPQVERQADKIDKVEIEAGRTYAKKRPRLNFEEMGIPTGSVLVFNATGEEATVQTPRSVMFRGEEMSITNATRLALGEGYAYNVAPGPYWTFNGKKVRDIYDETYRPVE